MKIDGNRKLGREHAVVRPRDRAHEGVEDERGRALVQVHHGVYDAVADLVHVQVLAPPSRTWYCVLQRHLGNQL